MQPKAKHAWPLPSKRLLLSDGYWAQYGVQNLYKVGSSWCLAPIKNTSTSLRENVQTLISSGPDKDNSQSLSLMKVVNFSVKVDITADAGAAENHKNWFWSLVLIQILVIICSITLNK